MARNLTDQVREIAEVVRSLLVPKRTHADAAQTKAVARGDLGKTVTADVQGEILELKITVNDMVSPLRI